MTNKKLLKSFLVLALMFALSSSVFASEVTGTLSSSASGSGDQASGTLGGTVSDDSSSGGGGGGGRSSGSIPSGGGSGGTVLGASTEQPAVDDSSYSNSIAYGGTALQPSYRSNSTVFEPALEQPIEVAQAFDGSVFSASTSQPEVTDVGGGMGVWFWIILILLLAVIARYVYNRNKKESTNY
jgi:hypothetical protein